MGNNTIRKKIKENKVREERMIIDKKEEVREKIKQEKGITLVALVVTIIILLILAGVTIRFILNQGGIFNKASEAKEVYSEQAAKESLELVLGSLAIEKVTNSDYNETTFIDDAILKESMEINQDIVSVSGWSFQIDRSVPKIIASLGRSKKNEEIKITATSKDSVDGVTATIQVQIQFEGELKEITIGGEIVAIPTPANGMYTLTKQVNQNGIYVIWVKDKMDGYQTATIKIGTIMADTDIYTKEDLVQFRENVNKGRAYENMTIRVKANIDLESEEWIPIGNTSSKVFKGTFDGENHKIQNLKITNGSNIGLFGYLSGSVKNTRVQVDLKGNNKIGGIAGQVDGAITIENCGVSGSMSGTTYVGGVFGVGYGGGATIKACYNLANISAQEASGGITAAFDIDSKITSCYNRGTITGIDNFGIGGICGNDSKSKIIENCYNAGEIKVSGVAYAGGIVGNVYGGTVDTKVNNCYNLGKIKGNGVTGGVIGRIQTGIVDVNHCYSQAMINSENMKYQKIECPKSSSLTTTNLTADTMPSILSVIGEEFQEDTNSINGGYPILKWQM